MVYLRTFFLPKNLSSAVGKTRLFVLFAVFFGTKSEVRIGQNLGQARFRENSVFRIVLFSKTAGRLTSQSKAGFVFKGKWESLKQRKPLGTCQTGHCFPVVVLNIQIYCLIMTLVFDGWKESFKDVHKTIFQLWRAFGSQRRCFLTQMWRIKMIPQGGGSACTWFICHFVTRLK